MEWIHLASGHCENDNEPSGSTDGGRIPILKDFSTEFV
jgi:hypothetical protein